jgi:hypothetical protein
MAPTRYRKFTSDFTSRKNINEYQDEVRDTLDRKAIMASITTGLPYEKKTDSLYKHRVSKKPALYFSNNNWVDKLAHVDIRKASGSRVFLSQEQKDKIRADKELMKDTLFLSNASNVLSGLQVSESIVNEVDPYKKSIGPGNGPVLI